MKIKSLAFLFVVAISMLFIGSASATVSIYNDWFEDSSINASWLWLPAPDGSWDSDTSAAGHLVVASSAEANLLQVGEYDNYPNSTLETKINAYIMLSGSNYEHIRLILNDSSGNVFYMRTQRSYSTRVIRTYEGAASLATYDANQDDTYGMKMRIVKRTDSLGNVNLSTYYKLDTGDWVQQTDNRTVTNNYDSCGLSFTGGSYFYVDYFTFTNDDTGESIPLEPSSYTPVVSLSGSTIDIGDNIINESALWYDISQQTSATTANDTYLEEVEPGVWELKGLLTSSNLGQFVFEGSELRISRQSTGGGQTAFNCSVNWTDTSVYQWNGTSDEADPIQVYTRWHFRDNTTIRNTNVDSFSILQFGDADYGGAIEGLVLDNVSMTNWYKNVNFKANNATINNLTMTDVVDGIWVADQGGIDASSFMYSTISDVYVNVAMTHEKNINDATGGYPFQTSGEYNVYRNIFIENSTYSGFVTGGEFNKYFNITVKNSDHNQIECRSNNEIWDGITVIDGEPGGITDSGILFARATSDSIYGHNISMNNLTILNNGSAGSLKFDGDLKILTDYHFHDAILKGTVWLFGLQNSSFTNCDITEATTTALAFSRSTTGNFPTINVSLIDCTIDSGLYYTYYGYNNTLANTNGSFGSGYSGNSYYKHQLLNAIVVNSTGYAVNGAQLNFSSDAHIIDEDGNWVTSILTGEDGKPIKRTYIPDTYTITGDSTISFTTDIDASLDGEVDTVLNINPDSTWQSDNVSDPQGTLYTFTLDVIGSGDEPIPEDPLSISSSSPSGSTISMYNTSTLSTFISVNKIANVSVYLDGALIQTNATVSSATYTNSSMTVGIHNLTMLASVGGESVNRVWTVTVSEYISPSEDTINLDLTVQQIITAIILGGLIPLVIVTVILFSNLNSIQIDNSKVVTAMIIIAVILVLTVVILNPLVEWI